MVGLFYYENVGKNCRKILQYEGRPSKILLFPDENGLASGVKKHWLLKTVWWSKRYCKIIEVIGGVQRRETRGRLYNYPAWGVMVIVGKFAGKAEEMPDFCVRLSSEVSREDFRAGYSMSGVLEQGDFSQGVAYLTHYAMIKRRDVV
ncbi:uncharacterized protein LOC129587987 [Paramacrobiotus metropolitanus]|uniref:uncharacterized protein LOC129587987 n=1 Tax=Paramacrobiotus metropolitanus TaxID=2943436 RepID=UPI0024460901|nr:uncharacterized protein LOC129587987 [Paramacrobiotus metropolitanus]XP_055337952.1 uncharacterized protein LOC129587987 [Paramacrobiotus metropolitanus]XP_055337953.1 uncharacterized protein LOC129587987 [Paramacrobiotus metropolitanus]XP_055337955.1 uncharacterized protein LOC129587987 [Paramacrobiotus metropolitanus]